MLLSEVIDTVQYESRVVILFVPSPSEMSSLIKVRSIFRFQSGAFINMSYPVSIYIIGRLDRPCEHGAPRDSSALFFLPQGFNNLIPASLQGLFSAVPSAFGSS
jgi:hypothetical protein